MHCEWCGQKTSLAKGATDPYGSVLCRECTGNAEILRAVKEDFKRRRARGW